MAERGNTKHGPVLDEQMNHETQGVKPAHAEEWRDTEAFPDDTEPAAVQEATIPAADPYVRPDEETER